MLPKNFLSSQPDGKLYHDSVENSLYLRNKKTKTWFCIKRKGKNVRWIKIGYVKDISLSDARKLATIEKSKIILNNGIILNDGTNLLNVWTHYREEFQDVKRSILSDEKKVLAHPNIFSIPICNLSPELLRALKRDMVNTPVAFNRLRALISVLLNYARKTLEIHCSNIVEHVARYPETPKETFVPIEKASLFFNLLESNDYSRDFKDIVSILIYEGQRSGNVQAMRWDEIDFPSECWNIPAAKSKNKRSMPTGLTPEVLEILRRRFNDPNHDPVWVFPKQKKPVLGKTKVGYVRAKGPGHVISIKKQFRKFAAALGIPNLSPHDLRRTHGTWMLNAGASIEQVSSSLHHQDIRVTQKVYAKLLTSSVRKGVDLMRKAIKEERNSEWE